MAGSYNKIILIGNLSRDPQTRALPSGTPVATFSVATSERRRGQDGQPQEQTCPGSTSSPEHLQDRSDTG